MSKEEILIPRVEDYWIKRNIPFPSSHSELIDLLDNYRAIVINSNFEEAWRFYDFITTRSINELVKSSSEGTLFTREELYAKYLTLNESDRLKIT